MRNPSATERRARGVSLVLLAACLLTLASTAVGVRIALLDHDGRTGYHVGERVDLPADWFRGDSLTLLVFVRSDCSASRLAVDRLVDARRTLPQGIRLVAVVGDRTDELNFALAAGFERSSIRTADFAALRLRRVPSLLLVDSEGVVQIERLGAPASGDYPALLTERPQAVSGL
jgi:hypothetical protein